MNTLYVNTEILVENICKTVAHPTRSLNAYAIHHAVREALPRSQGGKTSLIVK